MTTLISVSDLYVYGAPQNAFGSLTDDDKMKGIDAALEELESAAAAQGRVPLLAPLPFDCKLKVIVVAAYELMCQAGFNPTVGADRNYIDRCVQARDYFKQIARNEIHPKFVFSAPRSVYSAPRARSKPLRGI